METLLIFAESEQVSLTFKVEKNKCKAPGRFVETYSMLCVVVHLKKQLSGSTAVCSSSSMRLENCFSKSALLWQSRTRTGSLIFSIRSIRKDMFFSLNTWIRQSDRVKAVPEKVGVSDRTGSTLSVSIHPAHL